MVGQERNRNAKEILAYGHNVLWMLSCRGSKQKTPVPNAISDHTSYGVACLACPPVRLSVSEGVFSGGHCVYGDLIDFYPKIIPER